AVKVDDAAISAGVYAQQLRANRTGEAGYR
ncbi:MAG: hypothetical protein JWQ10_1430, partial [Herbaspirillum sp.]|nr:hypothetical protein [Herbaspirillum sp.]